MTYLTQLRLQKEELLAAAARHRAGNLRIFGSVARGEERADSDVDWLVDFADNASLLDLLGLQDELERITQRKADIVTPGGLSPFLQPMIIESALSL